jgi:AraC family transcriptional regulator
MSTPIIRDETVRSHYESVERVIAAMRERMDEPLSLGSMAKIAFASRYHFNRTFRQVTGVPPSQFLYALRLERAKRLLAQTQQKVIDICYGVGYNSVGTFTRRFTNLLGISPRAFRERVQSPVEPISRYPGGAAAIDGDSGRSGYNVSGYVTAPARFHGLIFIGLFETAIPKGKPVACAITMKSGPYHFAAPQGEFYLFALGLKYPIQAPDCFHYESALRGGGHLLRVSLDSVEGTTYLRVRPPSPFDPPILLALPLLMKPAPARNGTRDHAPEHLQAARPPMVDPTSKFNRLAQ